MLRRKLALLLTLSALIILANAATVRITANSVASYAGFDDTIYYENANAPVTGCTLPCIAVDTQTPQPGTGGSFTLAPGASMYLWSPAFAKATTVPAGGLGLQVFSAFATLPPPKLDGTSEGTWSSGSSFTLSVSTTKTNDVVVLWIVTYLSGGSIPVSGVSDSLGKIVWQAAARTTYQSCTHKEETTQTEWYGTASSSITSDVVTISLSGTPSAASAEELAVSGASIASPFDPNTAVPASFPCSPGSSVPSVSGLSTSDSSDFVFALYGGYTSTTETTGLVAGTSGTLLQTYANTGDSLAGEYALASAPQNSQSCAFGTTSQYWGMVCDAIAPGGPVQGQVSISAYATDPTGNNGVPIVTGALVPINSQGDVVVTIPTSTATIQASGYLEVVIVGPSNAALTVYWGGARPTDFQAFLQYRTG